MFEPRTRSGFIRAGEGAGPVRGAGWASTGRTNASLVLECRGMGAVHLVVNDPDADRLQGHVKIALCTRPVALGS